MPAIPPFKHLVLDIGNVLLPFDSARMAARAAEILGCDPAMVITAIHGLNEEFETGRMSEEDFFKAVAARLRGNIAPDVLEPLWCDIFEVNLPMVNFMRATRARGIPVYLLSNTNPAHVRFFERHHPFILETDGRVYSHLEGVMKPDRLIFDRLIARYGIYPKQTLFVDDLEKNIATARSLGFIFWHYDAARHQEFLAALSEGVGI